MVAASDLRGGMIVQLEGGCSGCLLPSTAPAAARCGRGPRPLQALPQGGDGSPVRPDERVAPVDVERQTMEFLYQEATPSTS